MEIFIDIILPFPYIKYHLKHHNRPLDFDYNSQLFPIHQCVFKQPATLLHYLASKMCGFYFQVLVLRIPHRDTPRRKCKSERNCILQLFSS